jgi:hypothetical protein
MRRLCIPNFAGLGNRLEALTFARALQEAHGGEILLDWPELDALHVPFARRGRLSWLDRRRAKRLRNCDESQFGAARDLPIIELRGLHGPDERMRGLYLRTSGQLRLHRDLKGAIEQVFERAGVRSIVGVHLRRGDFPRSTAGYDATRPGPNPAVPIEWIEAAMQQCLKFWPDCAFFVSASCAEDESARLRRNFDLIQLPLANPYAPSDPGHRASTHPAADLFALACCEVIVATPLSSFSHFAANALGPPTTCIVPPQRMEPGETTLCRLDMHGQVLSDWLRVFREPSILRPFDGSIVLERDAPRPQTDWILSFVG